MTKDLIGIPAVELAALIARGDVSSVEVVEAHIERIEQVNSDLNAVVFPLYENARKEAREADKRRDGGEPIGPLHGVPITIKECLDVAGTPSTFGLSSRRKLLADEDDPYVARMREAGAVILGKTNVAQCLIYYESDNPVYGRTNNPWNLERTPGGSSGGEGAIIAAGGSPLGLGTDIGGSLRIPAAFCGIASLKPTNGRVPDWGRYSIPIGQRAVTSQAGVLARHVADVALGLEIINRTNTEPSLPFGDFRSIDVSKLRVAYYTDDGTFTVATAVRRAVGQAADILKQQGAEVLEWTPPDVSEAVHLFFALLSGDGGRGLKKNLAGNKIDPRVKNLLYAASLPRPARAVALAALKAAGQSKAANMLGHFGYTMVNEHWKHIEAQMQIQHRFAKALDRDGIDVILCPPCALPAYLHGASNMLGVAGGYAILYNLLGYPAGVVPVTRVQNDEEAGRPSSTDIVEKTALKVEQGSSGLPAATQVVARPWQEHVALAVMHAIEEVARLRPDYPNYLRR